MSHIQRALIAMAIVVMTVVSPMSKLQAGGIPVIDTADLVQSIVQALASRMTRHGGAAILIDYGGWRSLGDTFQAVRGHAFADPFAEPGRADLTAHVDFAALAAAAKGVTISALTPQGDLLRALGIEARAERLARNLTGAALDSHRAALHRLTDASEMGTETACLHFF